MAQSNDSDEAYSLPDYPKPSTEALAPEYRPAEEDPREPLEIVAGQTPGERRHRNALENPPRYQSIPALMADMMRQA